MLICLYDIVANSKTYFESSSVPLVGDIIEMPNNKSYEVRPDSKVWTVTNRRVRDRCISETTVTLKVYPIKK